MVTTGLMNDTLEVSITNLTVDNFVGQSRYENKNFGVIKYTINATLVLEKIHFL